MCYVEKPKIKKKKFVIDTDIAGYRKSTVIFKFIEGEWCYCPGWWNDGFFPKKELETIMKISKRLNKCTK
jgi:hypothetical protein